MIACNSCVYSVTVDALLYTEVIWEPATNCSAFQVEIPYAIRIGLMAWFRN
jgi:hypothetical protein